MKINRDLVDATMMLSFIILVLVGTTDFESMATKEVTMGVLGAITAVMVVLRIIDLRHPREESID